MTRKFLQYGYTATGKALQVYQATGRYTLPRHEALRAIMLGNQSVYADEYFALGNPFDAKLGRTRAQLLRLYILNALVNYSSKFGFQQLDGEEIKNSVRTIGFGDELTLAVLDDLCRHRFAFTASHTPASLTASFLPSRLGGYVVRVLLGDLMFLTT